MKRPLVKEDEMSIREAITVLTHDKAMIRFDEKVGMNCDFSDLSNEEQKLYLAEELAINVLKEIERGNKK